MLGTNTDAVVMQSDKFLGGAKVQQLKIFYQVLKMHYDALNKSKTESKDIEALIMAQLIL